jgi:sporulation protein YtfJ
MATDHPIQGLMKTAMENIREMVDVNTIIGDPVETSDGHLIIPVSKVGFGFAAGGSEFNGLKADEEEDHNHTGHSMRERDRNGKKFPFGGGSGGGVSITPVAFIVVGDRGIRLLSMESSTHLYDRILDAAPGFLEQLRNFGRRKRDDDPCH